jgi:orotate phosphoribosyltransferase
MTTKADKIAALKSEHPTLKSGSDEDGYTDLSAAEYEARIEEWAENALAKEAKIAADTAEAEAVATAKAEAATKLTALGIDPKALGL